MWPLRKIVQSYQKTLPRRSALLERLSFKVFTEFTDFCFEIEANFYISSKFSYIFEKFVLCSFRNENQIMKLSEQIALNSQELAQIMLNISNEG